jgi:excisionase family DNA binding protein
MKIHTRQDEQSISVEELSHRTGWDPMTIYEKANSGDIPGAVWGETLRFENEKIEAWLMPISTSELEEILKELEQEGRITSYVDVDGQRRYIVAEHKQQRPIHD